MVLVASLAGGERKELLTPFWALSESSIRWLPGLLGGGCHLRGDESLYNAVS